MRPRGFIRLSGLALIKRNNTAAQQCVHIRNAVVIESGINRDADHGLDQTVRAHTVAHLLGHKGGHVLLGFLVCHGRAFPTDDLASSGSPLTSQPSRGGAPLRGSIALWQGPQTTMKFSGSSSSAGARFTGLR